MVPFSFRQALLKSRVMKERSWPSSPLTGAKRVALLTCITPLCACGLAVLTEENKGNEGNQFQQNWRKSYIANRKFLSFVIFVIFCQNSVFHVVFFASVSVSNRPFLKTQKRLNEPNSKNVNPLSNIDGLTNCNFLKK